MAVHLAKLEHMSPSNPAPRHIVVVGATSAIAERCARLWAAAGAASLTLIARDADKLKRVCDDLRVRSPGVSLHAQVCDDFLSPGVIEAQLDLAFKHPPDLVLVAHGDLPDQAACQRDVALARRAIEVNGLSPVLWVESAVRRLELAGRGTVAVIGSVAGDRGRQSNYLYGAAKGLVDRHVQGLQHRLAGGPVHVAIVKPGPTATPMTAHLQAAGQKMASADDVARHIVDGLAQRKPVIYTPPIWWAIMMVIRHLPRFVFNRMKI